MNRHKYSYASGTATIRRLYCKNLHVAVAVPDNHITQDWFTWLNKRRKHMNRFLLTVSMYDTNSSPGRHKSVPHKFPKQTATQLIWFKHKSEWHSRQHACTRLGASSHLTLTIPNCFAVLAGKKPANSNTTTGTTPLNHELARQQLRFKPMTWETMPSRHDETDLPFDSDSKRQAFPSNARAYSV